MSDGYLESLSKELRAVGVRGARRRRILVEAADHLREGGADLEAFGGPSIVAQRFADELATGGARRSAAGSFFALAPAGIVYAALLLLLAPAGGWPDVFSAHTIALGLPAAFALLLAPQVAFVAGVLALLGALRQREAAVMPALEVRLFLRRSLVALVAGVLTLAALAVYGLEYRAHLASWWSLTALSASVAATVPLLAAGVTVARTEALRPATGGPAGDVFDDLGPVLDRLSFLRRLGLREHRWRFCLLVAVAVAGSAALGPLASGRVLDEGTKNGAAELLAIVCGFAALGRVRCAVSGAPAGHATARTAAHRRWRSRDTPPRSPTAGRRPARSRRRTGATPACRRA
jgi:hypothetical protein